MDKIRNEYIRGTAQVGWLGEKIREARLGWREDDGHIGRRMLRMELPKKRKLGKRFMDVVRDDMTVAEVTEKI